MMDRDILIRARQQASVCKAQGYPETHAFLTELGDEIERLRMRLAVVGAADAQAVASVKDEAHG